MSELDARRLCLEIIRIADGREELPYSEVASDYVVEQSFETLVDTLKVARKCHLLSFEGEQLFRGKHVPIKLTVKGLAVQAEPAGGAPTFKNKAFFDGDEAFKEVAQPDGKWNWCIVGPDPDKLPLAGGGSGGIQEMTGAMGMHANTFGLLRLNFGRDRRGGEEVKWVYVHANMVDDDEAEAFSAVERGKAMAKGPLMEAAIGKFAKVACKIEGTSKVDFQAEKVITKLAKAAGANAKQLTLDKYMEQLPKVEETDEGIGHLKSFKPEAIAEAMQHLSSLKPGAIAAETPVEEALEEIPEPMTDPTAKQRKKLPGYKVGDTIKVRVLGGDQDDYWMDDGTIVEIATEPVLLADGVTEVPVGALRVKYARDQRIKWVLPFTLDLNVQSSKRPRAPQKFCGEMWKETHGFFTIWHARYFELQMGSLSWWGSKESAMAGKQPHGSFPMLGLFTKVEGSIIKLTSRGCQGVVYCFDGDSVENTAIWEKCFAIHGKYAMDMCLYLDAEKLRKKLDEEKAGNEKKLPAEEAAAAA